MNEFGHYALCLAWLLSLYGTVVGLVLGFKGGESSEKTKFFLSSVNATMGVCLCCAASIAALAYGFLTDDYTNQYVWQFSNRDMQSVYKVSAIWGGMDGSMLLWAFFLSVSAALVASKSRSYPRTLMPATIGVINSSSLFFLSIVVFLTNPFRYLSSPFVPPDGNGLNPLLQNPYMAVHPPTLYVGFTAQAVPFALCMAALITGNLGGEWIRLTRLWSLIGWGFLTAGIVMGGHWAYVELGWGGFWAWDPVENASFLPWLTATAFLHSVMVQERKNMLKLWNIWLNILTYGLTVFGTFLTRSGVVQSVHAFASTDVGWVFLVYLGVLLCFAIYLSIKRREELRSGRKIESILSREAFFLMNNLVFMSIGFAILWGVLFPVMSEAFTGVKQAVGIPFFNAVNVPLFLFLIFLMGVGPLIAWKKASFSSLRKTFLVPFITALAIACLLVWAGILGFYPVLSYALCCFVLMTIFGELHRGLRAQAVSGEADLLTGATKLIRRHRTRYGGYLVHIGVLVVTVAITASMAHKYEKEFTLNKGESFKHGRFEFVLDDIQEISTNNYQGIQAKVRVNSLKNSELIAILSPELRSYTRNQETTTEVALHMSPREDIYIVLVGVEQNGSRAGFKLFINPLQIWLWFGTIIMILGVVIIIFPTLIRSREEAPEAVRVHT